MPTVCRVGRRARQNAMGSLLWTGMRALTIGRARICVQCCGDMGVRKHLVAISLSFQVVWWMAAMSGRIVEGWGGNATSKFERNPINMRGFAWQW